MVPRRGIRPRDRRSVDDMVVFVHQDVFLPARWFDRLAAAIETLEPPGRDGACSAASAPDEGLRLGWAGFHDGWAPRRPDASPEPVETLDEIVLILRRSSGLRFDPRLPHFHMYGPDICLQARSAGFTNYAIPAFCVHNTRQLIDLPREFFEGYRYIKRKWRRYLPIYTSCITITRFDTPFTGPARAAGGPPARPAQGPARSCRGPALAHRRRFGAAAAELRREPTMKRPIRVLYSFPHRLGAQRICYTAWQQVNGLAAAGAEVRVMAGSVEREVPPGVRVQPTLSLGRLKLRTASWEIAAHSDCTTGWWRSA